MASAMLNPTRDAQDVLPPQITSTEAVPMPETPKPKGAKRLLQKLQRISSSSSIARLRSSPSAYKGTGKGSVSCVSLNTASLAYSPGTGSPYGPRDFTARYATAPTSVAGTPGIDVVYQNTRGRNTPHDGTLTPSTPFYAPAIPGSYVRAGNMHEFPSIAEDYFSLPVHSQHVKQRKDFDFWGEIPYEIKVHILRFLSPKDIVRCSAVSKSWYKMCFDGQLWFDLDTEGFYRDIPAESLVKIVKLAGSFLRDLNLRGCVQLWEKWSAAGFADACQNLVTISLQDCRIDRPSIHSFLTKNPGLQRINLSNLASVTNITMQTIADNCPGLEKLNVEWCANVDTRGLHHIIDSCHSLRDLRAGETRGWNDLDIMHKIFEKNTLERLTIPGCDTLRDESLRALFEGADSEMDYLTGRRIVPPRKLRHINFARCRNITDAGINAMVNNVPHLEGLQLSKCKELTDESLKALLPTMPFLTHLDLDELDKLTNATLQELARAPCKDTLQHLCISYCEGLGDAGMLPVVKACQNLRSLDLDNTRISDLTLAEAAAQVRQRTSAPPLLRSVTWNGSAPVFSSRNRHGRKGSGSNKRGSFVSGPPKPKVGLRMTVYDCHNVTWTGIREVLSWNAEVRRPVPSFQLNQPSLSYDGLQTQTASSSQESVSAGAEDAAATCNTEGTIAFPMLPPTTTTSISSHPTQIIALRVFYGYQQTVQEHTRRVLRGDFAAASRLERKWAEYMMASEEAGAAMGVGNGGGTGNVNAQLGALGLAGNRRRRRRVREAQMMHADEEEGGADTTGTGAAATEAGVVGRRRRARTASGCAVM